jgi:MioC protein
VDDGVLVLIGTQTGNAERVAEAVADALEDDGVDVVLLDLYDVVPEMLLTRRRVIVVTSTWKEGRLPDNAIDFMSALEALAPDLAHLEFGVIGLGDHQYEPHYQHAALRIADALAGLGARRRSDHFEIDGGPSTSQTEAAVAWARRLFSREA